MFAYYCMSFPPFVPSPSLGCTDNLILTHSRATFLGGLNESCPIRLHQSLLALDSFPFLTAEGTDSSSAGLNLISSSSLFFPTIEGFIFPSATSLYKISASLVVHNIHHALQLFHAKSRIPYVTVWGSCTTPSCLLACQWELLCAVASFCWDFLNAYFYRKFCAASPVAPNSRTSPLTV